MADLSALMCGENRHAVAALTDRLIVNCSGADKVAGAVPNRRPCRPGTGGLPSELQEYAATRGVIRDAGGQQIGLIRWVSLIEDWKWIFLGFSRAGGSGHSPIGSAIAWMSMTAEPVTALNSSR